MKLRRGAVTFDRQRCGVIEEVEDGKVRFTYDAAWLSADREAISLTMPLQAEAYESKGLLPFFENLLPEGWLLELATAKLKISKDDAFGLLLATCADCPGAVGVEALE